MAKEISHSPTAAAAKSNSKSFWPAVLRWLPTSTDHIIAAENRLLSIVKTPHVVEQVNIGPGPPGSKDRFINTVSFESKEEEAPTIVMVHGYGVAQGLFFRNFDTLASRFRVLAIDQLGWGGSSRPDFTCKSNEETEAWFVDSLEEWRKAKNLSSFILLGHSFGGYVAAKYALKYPEHIKHLVLVGPAGFASAEDAKNEQFTRFKSTWKGAIINYFWESSFTPQTFIRGLGPCGPKIVRGYTNRNFGPRTAGRPGATLNEQESQLISDYMYHTLAGKASGELCLNQIFSLGAFARKPLLHSASEWKVPTTFIYGYQDWMDYQAAQEARKDMKVPCEIIRVPEAGHYVFIDKPEAFHSAVFYACRRFLSPDPDNESLPEGLADASEIDTL